MKGSTATSARSITALTTAENAMKAQSTNTTQGKELLDLLSRKISLNNIS
jgi:hypothetical protein